MKFNLIRTFFPKFFTRRGMELDRKKYEQKLKTVKSNEERINLQSEFIQCTLREWQEWLMSIEDRELVNRAKKAGVYLDDIAYAEYDKDDMRSLRNSHYYLGEFADMLLDPIVKRQLTQAYRKRLPEYRKERIELWGLWMKAGGVLIGIIGGLTGLFAVYNKCGLGN